MCQDEWLNESVIPSANENATACVTRRLRGASTVSFRNIYHRTLFEKMGATLYFRNSMRKLLDSSLKKV